MKHTLFYFNRNIYLLLFLLGSIPVMLNPAFAQKERITTTISRAESESHLRFLAADELRGRKTGTIELDIAARYIAEQFRKYGLHALNGSADFLQEVPLTLNPLPQKAEFRFLDKTFTLGNDLIWLDGSLLNIEAAHISLPSEEALEYSELKGKIVFLPLSLSREAVEKKRKLAYEKGGLALIEIFRKEHNETGVWQAFQDFFNTDRIDLNVESPQNQLPYFILSDTLDTVFNQFKTAADQPAKITMSGKPHKNFASYNVAGMIEGTDENLKKEFMVLTAHYDHIGVIHSTTSNDSIYNGARDNAVGTAGLINAAKYFQLHPPKRSLLFIAFTAEEQGFYGSEYYVNNPLVPLHQSVFNLNIDNAGYNDVGTITMFGGERSNVSNLVREASSAFELEAMDDPFPEQNFFERSDNFSFAQKGIPAMLYGMGYKAFDEEITKTYHKPTDEVESLDLDYIHNYLCSFILTAEKLANWDQKPYWTKGDEFEKIAEELYQVKEE